MQSCRVVSLAASAIVTINTFLLVYGCIGSGKRRVDPIHVLLPRGMKHASETL